MLTIETPICEWLPLGYRSLWKNEIPAQKEKIYRLGTNYSILQFVLCIQKENNSYEVGGTLGYDYCTVIRGEKDRLLLSKKSLITWHTHINSNNNYFSLPDWFAFAKSGSVVSFLVTEISVTIYIRTENDKLDLLNNLFDQAPQVSFNMFMLRLKKKLEFTLGIDDYDECTDANISEKLGIAMIEVRRAYE